ncbi:MAG: hypothetical protein JSR76_06545 [Verrucomicrobia bacterium]|nr:hypothetical protein [Verrucomicrobiota bacterium]
MIILNRRLLTTIFLPILLCASLLEPAPEIVKSENSSPIQQRETMSEEKLSLQERALYDQLGPIYQKIYLFALSEEERYRASVYVSRGLCPYAAVDVILRTERRKCESTYSSVPKAPPADRAMQSKKPLHVF